MTFLTLTLAWNFLFLLSSTKKSITTADNYFSNLDKKSKSIKPKIFLCPPDQGSYTQHKQCSSTKGDVDILSKELTPSPLSIKCTSPDSEQYNSYEDFLAAGLTDVNNRRLDGYDRYRRIRDNFHPECDYYHDYEANNKAGIKEIVQTLTFDHMFHSLKLKRAATDGNSETSGDSTFYHRSLANGDFNQLNRLMGKVAILVPDPDPIELSASVELEVLITNIVLTHVSIGDMTITHTLDAQNRYIDMEISIRNIGLTADINWAYYDTFTGRPGGILYSDGTAHGVTSQSFLDAQIRFWPRPGEKLGKGGAPPRRVEMVSVNPTVDLDDIEFAGTITAGLLGLLEPLVTVALESVIEDMLLTDLVAKDLMVDLFHELMSDLNRDSFDPWINDTLAGLTFDPMGAREPTLARLDGMEGKNDTQQPFHDVTLWNLTHPDNWAMSLVQDGIKNYLGLQTETFTNYSSLGINNVINGASDNTGKMSLGDLDILVMNGTDKFTTHQLRVKEIRAGGLNTFTHFNPLDLTSDLTINNEFRMDKLSIELTMRLALWPSKITDEKVAESTNDIIVEEFEINALELRDIWLDFDFLAAIDKYLGKALKVGGIWDTPVDCIVGAFHAINVTYLNITAFDDLQKPVLQGLIDPGTSYLVNKMADFAYDGYHDLMKWLLPMMSQTSLRNTLNGVLNGIRAAHNCPDPAAINPPLYINFEKEELVVQALELLHENLAGNLTQVNKLIGDATKDTSGKEGTLKLFENATWFTWEDYLGLSRFRFGLEFGLKDGYVTGLDSVSRLKLLETKSPFLLFNLIEMADSPAFPPANFTVNMHIGLLTDQIDIRNNFIVTFDMQHLTAMFTLLLKANKEKIKNIRLRETMLPICWYGTLNETGVSDFQMNFEDFLIDIDCNTAVGCSGPRFQQAVINSKTEAAMVEATRNVNSMMNKFTINLMGATSKETLNRKARGATADCDCQTNPDILSSGPRGAIDMETSYSPVQQYQNIEDCQEAVAIPSPFGNGVSLGIPEPIKMTAIVFIVMLMMYFIVLAVEYGHDQMKVERVEQRRREKTSKKLEDKRQYDLFKGDEALAYHKQTPPWMKVGVPSALIFCILMFMISHTNVLASVDIRMMFAGELIDLRGFARMMLKESLEQMWKAKVYSLFMILFGFSFLWPYIKLFGLLACWFMPPKSFRVSKRGGFIWLLDLLGKWSLIDIYVFILVMTAFLMHVTSPVEMEALLGLGFYEINLQVTPMVGLLCSMIGGVLMPATNEVMIIAHRNAVQDTLDKEYDRSLKEKAANGDAGEKDSIISESPSVGSVSSAMVEGYNPMARPVNLGESGNGNNGNNGNNVDNVDNVDTRQRRATTWVGAGTDDVKGYRKGLSKHKGALYRHVFENEGGADRICLRKPGQFLMFALILMPGVFGIFGCLMYSWTFDRNGVVGLIIDLGNEGGDLTQYSVWNVGLILVEEERVNDWMEAFTVFFCCVCCILFAFITPVLQHIAMLVLFFKEMTLKEMKIWYFIVEIFSGWATMDVFIVSIVVCLLQIGMLSEFLIPATCDFLDDVVPYGFVDEKDAMCFFVDANVGYGALFLLLGAVTSNIMLIVVQGAAQAAMKDRENRIKGISVDQIELNLGANSKIMTKMLHLAGKVFICDVDRKQQYLSDDAEWELRRRMPKLSSIVMPPPPLSESSLESEIRDSDSFAEDESRGSYQPPPPPMAPPDSPSEQLPVGWTEQQSDNGVYYWNFQTGETSWEKPVAVRRGTDDSSFVAPPPGSPPPDNDSVAPPAESPPDDAEDYDDGEGLQMEDLRKKHRKKMSSKKSKSKKGKW